MTFAPPRRWMPSAVVAAALAACGGAPPPPPPPPPLAPREVVEVARFQAFDGDALVAVVHQLEIRDPSGPVALYRIVDPRGRWLGHASANGRFSRRVPFRDEEEDLGVLAMARGVATLAGAAAPVRLQPVASDAAAAPAAARR
ncbi:MAG: hypothetical protein INH34_10280 [Phycisphaerales bacterium]|nr:hypothetical protein [Phycisphaerales bacterium]